ncbi:DUF423-domain-containing protein, partial [Rozella allomycis CSF55]
AFGAHSLKNHITDMNKIKSWETAAHYQLIHAAAVLAVSQVPSLTAIHPATLMLTGSCMFSGSIYLLVLKPSWKFLGPVTPLGGLLMAAGWAAL